MDGIVTLMGQDGNTPSIILGNEISKVEGLEGLQDLRELVLDRNKIKAITEYSFMNQWNLQELHMEENRLRDLTHIGCLENLQRLFLGMNRIQVGYAFWSPWCKCVRNLFGN